jgi:hypothetical protein
MASIRDTLTKLLASDKPEPGTPLARAVGQYPFQQGEAPLEAPMFSPDDLIGTGIGKAALVGAGKVAPMLAGTFIGESSPLFNKAANKLAQALEKKGVDPTEIWQKTGNAKYVDNKWRQEISDAEAKIKAEFDSNGNYYHGGLYPDSTWQFKDVDLGGMLEHPKLFEAYPEAKNIQIHQPGKMFSGDAYSGAYFSPAKDGIPNRIGIYEDRRLDPNVTKSSLLHEIGHYIQEKEGMAKGGSPSLFSEDMKEKVSWANQQIAEKNAQLDETYKMLEQARANKFNDPSAEKRIAALKNRYDKLLDEKLGYVKEAQLNPHEEAFKQYQKLAGEAEARLTQNRIPLTQEERLQHFPFAEGKYGLDVPYNELLVKGLLNK